MKKLVSDVYRAHPVAAAQKPPSLPSPVPMSPSAILAGVSFPSVALTGQPQPPSVSPPAAPVPVPVPSREQIAKHSPTISPRKQDSPSAHHHYPHTLVSIPQGHHSSLPGGLPMPTAIHAHLMASSRQFQPPCACAQCMMDPLRLSGQLSHHPHMVHPGHLPGFHLAGLPRVTSSMNSLVTSNSATAAMAM